MFTSPFKAPRRKFFAALGAAPLLGLRQAGAKPTTQAESQTQHLVDLAYAEATTAGVFEKWGKPYGVFVHFIQHSGTPEKECHEWLRIYWRSEGVVMKRYFDIDLGELHPDVNRHFRWLWRVADQLSERLGCVVGWSMDHHFHSGPYRVPIVR